MSTNTLDYPYKRFSILYRILYFYSHFGLRKYSWKTDVLPDIGEPYIALSNHLTEQDFLMLGSALPKVTRFVSGEHLMRTPFGKLIGFFTAPILAPRGASHVDTVRDILRTARAGYNIAIFPEGCRSFNGETLPVGNAMGKLIKKSGSALVTYRISGGYFIAPRWAYKFRKGHAEGKIVNVYSSQQLESMTTEEITDCINHDLHENAYETQRKKMYPYKGKALAEGLENFLLLCPECGSYDSLETSGNEFKCSCCGLHGVYDEFGFLKGDNLPFDNIYDYGRWLEKHFDDDMSKHGSELLFKEPTANLYEIFPNHTQKTLELAQPEVYKDKIILGSHEFLFEDIKDMSLLYYGKTILFDHKDGYFGITGDAFHAWKTDRLYHNYKSEAGHK